MAKFYSDLNPSLQNFIQAQNIFFTATAPQHGRINLSPKGMDTFRCIDNKTVAYLDLTGSGNETAAHVLENGRMTLMFCSFSEKPLILRLYGQGQIIRPKNRDWETVYPLFTPLPGERQIVVLAIESVQTSCGYGVPIYEFKEERKTLREWADKKGEQGIYEYWQVKNLTSIDGLPTNGT
ncbi:MULTISPECIES: pyridoxamine 5'-phosphate oxidase family protein [unclassified Coleofasciculus]|uniref:pyridoxamine 5'-phosphate oxidase family protein n=1 Tax=unclassified Coleofasciculus TaxID=2692782 RepID=UPI001881F621|nr:MULTISPECIES: pyridoxamine 5'-phosphate oxidase family protein [unclassified Coleofasciculus]MBE9128760.1 pyridoxamine 5'-phosphate oxidase family protein [Coleofasciculus sp. LEGE 07081]MBE9151229.1 pyridoxamine 5'-phosphate oxidase family protein [Coleofasciculus sp. LEGE 07092]